MISKSVFHIFGTAQKGRVLLALLCEQCNIAPRIGLSSSFHGVHLLLPNKAQKRLTASSLMLATSYHCGFAALDPSGFASPSFDDGFVYFSGTVPEFLIIVP